MARLFVSYSRVDSQFVEQFIPILRRVYGKENVWYDDDIHGGADWWQMILREIGKADIFIYLLSNDSLESSYCRSEMREALRLHKAFLPLMIRPRTDIDKAPQDLARIIRRTNWIDLTRGVKDTQATASLFGSINTLLDSRPSTPPPPAAPDPIEEPPVVDKKPAPPVTKPDFHNLWKTLGTLWIIAYLLVLVAACFVTLWDSDKEATPPTPTTSADVNLLTEEGTEVVLEPTESPTATQRPSMTLTRTRTPTATSTPSATLELLTQIAMEFTQTKIAGDAFASATAAQWTYTPSNTPTPTDTLTATPDYTQTYEKARDDFSASLTAESWTDTPTATLTPSDTPTPTATPTLTEREKAFKRAEEGVSSNDEWTLYVEEINGVEMVLVPAGCFMMGSEDGTEDEKPVHEQCFDEPFWIDRYEVTNAQFREFNGQAGRESRWTDNDRPRESITWFEARDFCESRGARLPTEKEWEYAARGPDNLVYPWGNEFVAENVVYRDNSGGQTAVVGSRPGGVSWVGALDMSGNVWEWVSSLYEVYPYTDERESNSDTNSVRGLRGGSWGYDDNLLRAAIRVRDDPDNENIGIGFRCVLSYEGG